MSIEQDITEYNRLQHNMLELIKAGKHMDSQDNLCPEYRQLWNELEQVKNRYKGNNPSLCLTESAELV